MIYIKKNTLIFYIDYRPYLKFFLGGGWYFFFWLRRPLLLGKGACSTAYVLERKVACFMKIYSIKEIKTENVDDMVAE